MKNNHRGRIVMFMLSLGCLSSDAKLAGARNILQYDLASYYYMSDVVVWVDELSYEKLEDVYHTDHREKTKVLKVYKGEVKPEEILDVLVDSQIARHKIWDGVWECVEWEKKYCKKSKMTRWNEAPLSQVLMFLIKSKDKRANYQLITMKLMVHNEIYDLKQVDNPGVMVLVEPKPEFITLPSGVAYGLKELEDDLMLAIERAKDFEAAYAAQNIEKLKKFLPLLPFQQYPGNHVDANMLSRKAAELIALIADKNVIQALLKECSEKYEKCEYYVNSVLKGAVKE